MSKETKKSESKPQGEWLSYELMMAEIGLYSDNAVRRIKEHKDHFNPITIPHLYHVAEYYEALGIAVVCSCLQSHCKDFKFTKEDIIESDWKPRVDKYKALEEVTEITGCTDKQSEDMEMTEIKAGNFYMCLEDISAAFFTKGKIYPSLYDNALINDNCIEVFVRPCNYFRIATTQEIIEQKERRNQNETIR